MKWRFFFVVLFFPNLIKANDCSALFDEIIANTTILMSRDLAPVGVARRVLPNRIILGSSNKKIYIIQSLNEITDPVIKMGDYVYFVRTHDPEKFPFPKGEFTSGEFHLYGGNIRGRIIFNYSSEENPFVRKMLSELKMIGYEWLLVVEYTPSSESKIKNLSEFIRQLKIYSESIPSTDRAEQAPQPFRQVVVNFFNRVKLPAVARMGFDIEKVTDEVNRIRSSFRALLSGSTEQLVRALGFALSPLKDLRAVLSLYDLPPDSNGENYERYKRTALIKYFSQAPNFDSGLLFQMLRDYEVDFDLYAKAFQQFIIEEAIISTPTLNTTGLYFQEISRNVVRVFGRSFKYSDPYLMLKENSKNGKFSVTQLTILEQKEMIKDFNYPLEFIAELRLP